MAHGLWQQFKLDLLHLLWLHVVNLVRRIAREHVFLLLMSFSTKLLCEYVIGPWEETDVATIEDLETIS